MGINERKGVEWISGIDPVTWYFVLGVLILSVCFDWGYYRIPNWLIFAGYGMGLFYQVLFHGVAGSILWLQGISFPIIILYMFFYCKMAGAGDIKLFSVVGGVSGVYSIIDVMTVSLFFGGLLSVIFIVRYKNLGNRLQCLLIYFSNVIKQKNVLPYVQRKGGVYGREDHIKEGHIHYSIAILCAVVYCRWKSLFENGI